MTVNIEEFEGFEERLIKLSSEIDEEIERMLSAEEEIPNLHDAIEYALGLDVVDRKRRGKRIRPVLCLMTCESLGCDYRKAMPFAIATEYIHNYTLIHDDIEDGDEMRRNRPSVWMKYGLPHGINVGDYLAAKVYKTILRSRDLGVDEKTTLRLFKLAIETMEHTAEGQALDIGSRAKKDIMVNEYMRIVIKKTSHYLAAPMIGGAIIAGASENILDSISEFGKFIGPMFQIVDDVIDLTEGKGRGEIGSDIKEGKRSFLVAYTASVCTIEEKRRMFEILDKPRDETTSHDINWVISLFNKYGTITYARKYSKELYTSGKNAIKNLPKELKANLNMAAKFMLERKS